MKLPAHLLHLEADQQAVVSYLRVFHLYRFHLLGKIFGLDQARLEPNPPEDPVDTHAEVG